MPLYSVKEDIADTFGREHSPIGDPRFGKCCSDTGACLSLVLIVESLSVHWIEKPRVH